MVTLNMIKRAVAEAFRESMKPERPMFDWGLLSASTVTKYTQVLKYTTPPGFLARVKELSLYSSRPTVTEWKIVCIDETLKQDFKIMLPSFTIPFDATMLRAQMTIVIMAKGDGTATDISATISGAEIYLLSPNKGV